jgi:predicted nucleic acid-binding protein
LSPKIFVLDENVIVQGITRRDEHGADDFSALNLLLKIYTKCDSLFIATNPYLHRKLREKVDRYKQGMNRSEVRSVSPILLVESMLKDSRKNNLLDPQVQLSEESKLPEDDRPIVRLAVEAKAILISCDGRLAERIHHEKMDEKYGLQVERPNDALDEAEQVS